MSKANQVKDNSDREAGVAKEYLFTIKHYPTNDLLALDLQDHLDQMAETGWELINTQQLVNDHSSTTPQMIIFWGRNDLH